MPSDFDEFKVSVFPNINDKPVEPTSSKAGNGAHIISQFNGLLDRLATPWRIINSNYTALLGDKIIIDTNGVTSDIIVTLPEDPPACTPVTLIRYGSDGVVRIHLNGARYDQGLLGEVKLETAAEEVTLIFLSVSYGWMPNRSNLVVVDYSLP